MTEPPRLDEFDLDGLLGLVRSGQLRGEHAAGEITARPVLARAALEHGMVNGRAMTLRSELYRQLVAWFAKDRGSNGFHQ